MNASAKTYDVLYPWETIKPQVDEMVEEIIHDLKRLTEIRSVIGTLPDTKPEELSFVKAEDGTIGFLSLRIKQRIQALERLGIILPEEIPK